MGQTLINWTLGERRHALRLFKPDPFIASDGKPVSAAAIKNLLRNIEEHAGRSGWCTASVITQADEMCVSKRVVIRALEACVGLRLVVVRLCPQDKRRKEYRVCWPNIIPDDWSDDAPEAELTTEKIGATNEKSVPPKGEIGATNGGDRCHHFDASHCPVEEIESQTVKQITKTPPPTPSTPKRRRDVSWPGVAAEMIELGVEQPGAAIRSAKSLGLSPGAALARCDWFREHHGARGYRPQALYHGIANCAPGTPLDGGWPKPAPQVVAVAASRALEAAAGASARRDAAERQKRSQSLEESHGSRLDEMTAGELAELVAGLTPWSRKWIGEDGRKGRGRLILLQRLEELEGACHA